jgi:phosphinothricin acetyltransferase
MTVRRALGDDASAIAAIYNQGVEERIATFETRPRTGAGIGKWLESRLPVVVVEADGRVIAFAATFEYGPRGCYAGIAEASLYVGRDYRRRGAGRLALTALMREAATLGFRKLLLKIFEENAPSISLFRSLGFRQVGVLERRAQLGGVWRNIVLADKLLG